MQAVGIVGFSNSGKTTLVSRLSECIEARGLRIAIAKYTHHVLDKPDTDTALLTKPGRTIIGLSNLRAGGGEAMIYWGNPCDLAKLIPFLDADVLLVEGGKTLGWLPRVLCLRSTPELLAALPNGLDALRPELALASYGENELPGLLAYSVEDLDALVDLILERAFLLPGLDCGACGEKNCSGLARRIVAGERVPADCKAAAGVLDVEIDGRPMEVNSFAPRVVGGLEGMLSALKGVAPDGDVVIRLRRRSV